ncbi:erg10, acetyl-CoA C-acetyltransferase [Perkinsus chesapeaki]|uniref:Erg10, acetyl-CoA C-acetyltransferase n=1 Tax=Perkinsus chesapeaki TaxID=330153 RepID=A0A7J6M8A5_PERCH|nr:erg10, acetyl-CoA C-acetyltransferase [Perkinsus chesapeaki]
MSHRLSAITSHVSPPNNEPVIVGYARTPLGSFGGALASLRAQDLGAHAIRSALQCCGLPPSAVEEVLFGQVLTAGCGQAPHRQAALLAGLSETTPCTGVNKVCASGMKTVMLASSMIKSGERKIMVVGGMESMSNAPYADLKARWGLRHGHGTMTDLMVRDGLTDAYDNIHMGECAERTAERFSLSREAMDDYASRSIRLARDAQEGLFQHEIAPIEAKGRRGKVTVVRRDEQVDKVSPEQLSKLKPAFRRSGGAVTAGNASPLSDGACAIVMMSRQEATSRGIRILASVASMADAATTPQDFTIAPASAAKLAIDKLPPAVRSEIGVWEFNEAFAAVVLANNKLLEGIVNSKDVNVNGGAIAIGHPLGCSGRRPPHSGVWFIRLVPVSSVPSSQRCCIILGIKIVDMEEQRYAMAEGGQAGSKREWDPTLEPLMKVLMSKKGINHRNATEVGKKVVTIIRGKELTEFLLNNGALLKKRCPDALKEYLDGKMPESEADNAKLVIPLIRGGFMFRCVDATIQATDKPSGSTERRRRKWPDRVARVAPQHQGYDPKGLYIVEWEGSKTMQYVLLAVIITAVLLMCLFPVWPLWAKFAVWYLTVAFSTFMIALLIIRMVFYVALWAFGADFWIFPNLLDEDLGVIESFQPLYSFAYRSDDWLMIICRVLSVGVIGIALHQLSQTHSLSDIGEFAKVQFLDIVEWGENKLQSGPEMKQRFPSLEQVKQETEVDFDNDTERVHTDYTTQDTGDQAKEADDDMDDFIDEEQ